MAEVWECDICGAETGFVVNAHPYCPEHAAEGAALQVRLSASLAGLTGDELEEAGQWAMAEVAEMLRTQGLAP
jgi:hypothetical protein